MKRFVVVELVKRYTLRWFAHIERMKSDEFVKSESVKLRVLVGEEGQ